MPMIEASSGHPHSKAKPALLKEWIRAGWCSPSSSACQANARSHAPTSCLRITGCAAATALIVSANLAYVLPAKKSSWPYSVSHLQISSGSGGFAVKSWESKTPCESCKQHRKSESRTDLRSSVSFRTTLVASSSMPPRLSARILQQLIVAPWLQLSKIHKTKSTTAYRGLLLPLYRTRRPSTRQGSRQAVQAQTKNSKLVWLGCPLGNSKIQKRCAVGQVQDRKWKSKIQI